MTRYLAIESLIFFLCSSMFVNVWSQSDIPDLYPVMDKSSCAFPFTYNGKKYTDCTTDGDNGDILWCSLTNDYAGLITYCYDFRKTTLQCVPTFTMPNGKTYTGCALLSPTQLYQQCKTNNTDVKYRYCTPALSSTGSETIKRNPNCDQKYASLAYNHTICYGPSIYANVIPLTDDEIQDILDTHNSYRAAVTSRYMFQLYWDNELAKLAQAHSNLCAFEHDLAVNRLSPLFGWKNGQNIVMSSEIRSSPASLIDAMLSAEKDHFKYGKGCSPDNTCLHYTQAMLSNLTRVGCGQTHCVFPDRIERYITCNYIQSQYTDNYATPYVPSKTSCVDCPLHAINGLCDCGNKICNFTQGQYLDPASCNCKTPMGKRSIEKRDATEDDLINNAGQDVILPVGKLNFRSIEKPHIKHIKHNHSVGKRSAGKHHIKYINQHRNGKRSVQGKHMPALTG